MEATVKSQRWIPGERRALLREQGRLHLSGLISQLGSQI